MDEKKEFWEIEQQQEQEEDIYDAEFREELVDDDEISDVEEAFMQGYEDCGEE
jgi:hypothetical protein